MINHIERQLQDIGINIRISSFLPYPNAAERQDAIAEHHAMLIVEPRGETFTGQLNRLYEAEQILLSMEEISGSKAVMKRYFLSDATNQVPLMRADESCAVSYIQQPPLDGSKIALWVYMTKGMDIRHENGTTVAEHNGYKHLWRMNMCENQGNSAEQTAALLEKYEQDLAQKGGTLADNCIRTWFFVRDVDTQYAGLVKARRENFVEQGLTPDTHYIASTGIGGNPADPKALIQFGAYAITGLKPEQQRYLHALTHLNRTIEYGVTFERATRIEYGDRAHIYVSGTASINNKGEVVHVGDIVNQTYRMWENVEKLLEEGSMTFGDVMQIVVYLRDNADYDIVSRMFAEKFPDMPLVITLAPVCRPTWLIEMECVAVSSNNNPELQNF